jgi:hypothetical protein
MSFTLFVAFGCTSDTDFENGKAQLENMGYTKVEKTGYKMWCCGEDDDFSTGFRAVDKNGNTVKGCFCSGIGKGVTIRFK